MKILYIFIYFGCLLTILVQNVFGDNTTLPDDKIDNYDETQPYCFRFTWIGPNFDNTSKEVNTTCDEYLDGTRAKNVPCRQPLVYTYDGSPPDIDYLWENHRQSVLCRQSRGLVCATYSYSYDNEIQNKTYMCTKVFVAGEKALKNGCFKQEVNGYDVELCVCNSQNGPRKPCNSASTYFISVRLLIILTFLTIVGLVI